MVVSFLKGKSVIKMFGMHSELKKRYWGRHFDQIFDVSQLFYLFRILNFGHAQRRRLRRVFVFALRLGSGW